MKSLYIKDLSAGTSFSNEGFAVKSAEVSQTKDGKTYYKIILMDRTGEIKGQIWPDNLKRIEKNALKPGNVVTVNGFVDEYKGNLQLTISDMHKVDESSLTDYMESSDFDLEELFQDLKNYIQSVESKDIKKFLEDLFADDEISRKFKTYPAAEMVHHSFRGGLVEHVVEMLDLSKPLKRFYPEANFDLITAGVIMHDIGKLYELEPVGVAVKRTTEGYLLGHLVKSYEILINKGKDLNLDNMLNLKHIILSHHGSLEFGSPVLPATIEAIIVSYLDQLSSQVRIYQKLIRRNVDKKENFSEFDRIAGTKIYLGNLIKQEAEKVYLEGEISGED